MNTTNTKRGLGRRIMDFIDSFDHTSSDYLFDQVKHSAVKLSELEQRVIKLEQPQTVLQDVRHKKAV